MTQKPRRIFTDEQKGEAVRLFGTLKTELIYLRIFSSRTIAQTTIAEWIEVFYNR